MDINNSAKVQAAFGIPGPIYGRLWAGEQLESTDDLSGRLEAGGGGRASVSARAFVGLAVEGELAVVLVETPGEDVAAWTVDYFPVRPRACGVRALPALRG